MIEPDQIIYLDNNATTQLDPAVVEEMVPYLSRYYGNPSSGYTFGAQVRQAVELARERVAALIGCTAGEIIFTSGGTESNNTAVNSALQLAPDRRHVVTTAVEHSAVLRHCEQLRQRGYDVTFVGVEESGELRLDELESAIRPDTALLSVMWANNETGVLFPLERVAELAHRRGVLFHTDAVQTAGKLPIGVRNLRVNSLSLSAHKIHGPKGVGALFVHRTTPFRPLLFGGGQENNRRAGTENVASIVGFGKAAERALAALADEIGRVRLLRDKFETAMRDSVDGMFVNGGSASRLPNTSSLSFRGIESGAALILLDQDNVCCSAGSACRTGSHEASHVLRAMKIDNERLRGSLRFSFGRFNTESDVDRSVPVIRRVVERLRALSAGGAPPVAA